VTADDRRVLNGIFWVLRTGAPWRALPKEFGPRTTCYNRFVRRRKAGVWDHVLATRGTPRGLFGSSGAITSHSKSVSS
jgi:transposase